MKRSLLQRLTGPVTVLRIRFTDTANYSMSLFVLDCTGEQIRVLHREDEPDAAVLKRECAARPVLVSVAGHGIITKPADGPGLRLPGRPPGGTANRISGARKDTGSVSGPIRTTTGSGDRILAAVGL